MKIWICIPVFNRIQFSLKCLQTLHAQTFKNFVVVICDHGSTDGTTERIKHDFPETIVINADSSLWWTGAINRCVEFVLQHASIEDTLLTLNNDTELPIDYLAEFAANHLKYPHAVLTSVVEDIATGKLVSVGHRHNWWLAQGKAVTFEHDHLPNDPDIVEVTHASGRGTLFPIAVFKQLGLYDEVHLPHYAADYDYTQKARRAGFPVYVCRNCRVLSYVDATGMTTVRAEFSIKSFINYLTSIRSNSNIMVRWWFAWNNCPKLLLPTHFLIDVIRVVGNYFRYFLRTNP